MPDTETSSKDKSDKWKYANAISLGLVMGGISTFVFFDRANNQNQFNKISGLEGQLHRISGLERQINELKTKVYGTK